MSLIDLFFCSDIFSRLLHSIFFAPSAFVLVFELVWSGAWNLFDSLSILNRHLRPAPANLKAWYYCLLSSYSRSFTVVLCLEATIPLAATGRVSRQLLHVIPAGAPPILSASAICFREGVIERRLRPWHTLLPTPRPHQRRPDPTHHVSNSTSVAHWAAVCQSQPSTVSSATQKPSCDLRPEGVRSLHVVSMADLS